MAKTGQAMLAPSIAVIVSTLFWGTLWIPLRQLSQAGLGGPWATAPGFALPLLVLIPLGVIRRRSLAAQGWQLALTGMVLAVCLALYSEGLVRGNVARVILLFYLAPVWSTVLARAFLATPVTGARMVTVALGLAGMLIVFGIDSGLPLPRETGEWMGLASGFLWAVSMVALRRDAAQSTEFGRFFSLFVFLAPACTLLTLVPGGQPWVAPTAQLLLQSSVWLALLGLVWMPAAVGLTMFGGSRLDPGRVAVLLTLEVVIGLASAAVLANEPLGAREMAGAALIIAACGSEFFAPAPVAASSDDR